MLLQKMVLVLASVSPATYSVVDGEHLIHAVRVAEDQAVILKLKKGYRVDECRAVARSHFDVPYDPQHPPVEIYVKAEPFLDLGGESVGVVVRAWEQSSERNPECSEEGCATIAPIIELQCVER